MRNEHLRQLKLGASAATIGAASLLSPIDTLAAPSYTSLSQELSTPAQPEHRRISEVAPVPVFFHEAEIHVDFPPLYRINSETNLREQASTDSPIVQKLQPGYVVRQSETSIINSKGEHFFPATVEFDGSSVVTDVITGNLREDVRGSRLDPSEIPPPLQRKYMDQAKRDNTPPISRAGEFSISATLDTIQNEGGDEAKNTFVAALFNEPPLVEDAKGQMLTFFERAASGTEFTATFDYATGLQVYDTYLHQTSDSHDDTTISDFPRMWTAVSTDEENTLKSWQAVPFRLLATHSDGTTVDYFYYRDGTLGEDRDLNNVLLTYQELIEIIGNEVAQQAARDASVIQGLTIADGQVKATSPNETLLALLTDIDAVFIDGLGVVPIPGNQELASFVEKDEEIASVIYRDQMIVVENREGNAVAQLVPIKNASGDVEWKELEEAPVYDNDYLANLLRTKKLEEFDDGPLDFEAYIETADTHLIFPLGGANGFSKAQAETMKQVYDQVYASSPAFKDFMDTTPRVRAYVNFTYPEGRDVLSSPNFLRGYLLQKDQEITDQEAKKTYGYLFVILSEYSIIEEWASRFSGQVDHIEEFEKGLLLVNEIHEFWRTHHATQGSIVGLDNNDPAQLELISQIVTELETSGSFHPDFFKGISEQVQHLQNTIK